ncbi:MAG TPA: aminopeptidase, partial [Steroidobacteraceae bacterium]|nr:aminopeptidase [Steroidobacteraceae bacterium]
MFFVVRVGIVAAMLAALSGCGTLYLAQAAHGQWQVMHARKPIDKVIANPDTPEDVRAHLAEVRAAREFASRALALPDNRSYRSYADLKRPYVVWNVVAAPEFSVQPRRWCFPIAGCVAYRGYFSEAQARKFAASLKAEGLDVFVGGVPAYSTLGKFADPV